MLGVSAGTKATLTSPCQFRLEHCRNKTEERKQNNMMEAVRERESPIGLNPSAFGDLDMLPLYLPNISRHFDFQGDHY
jgi:hypothetical protein